MDYSLWPSAIFGKIVTEIKIILRTSFESSFYVDHNGTIPNFISHSQMARYLGLGMRYEAGICTIVISMNGAFQ